MGGNSIGMNIPGHHYTRAAAAKSVNRSADTLKRWQKSGIAVPSSKMKAGQLTVWLYTDEDMNNLRAVAKSQKPGRPKKKKD